MRVSMCKAVIWKRTGRDSNLWPLVSPANALPLSHTETSFIIKHISFTFTRFSSYMSSGKKPIFMRLSIKLILLKHRRKLKVLTKTSGLASSFLHPPSDFWENEHWDHWLPCSSLGQLYVKSRISVSHFSQVLPALLMWQATQNRSFWRHSSQPISWLSTEETKSNTTKASNTRKNDQS